MDNTVLRISDLLDYLSDIELETNTDNYDRLKEQFVAYYESNGRHKYHEIASYILKASRKTKEGEKIQVVAYNLRAFCDYIKSELPDGDKCLLSDCNECSSRDKCGTSSEILKTKVLLKSLEKLYDHIQLEYMRWTEINQQNIKLERKNKELIRRAEQLKEQQNVLTDQQDEIIGNYDYMNLEFEKVKDQMSSIYIQFISILGIFAAIVIAVFGGMNVMASITTAFSHGAIDLYRTILVSSMVTLFVIWVIFTLLGMVRWFKFKALPTKFTIFMFVFINIVCIGGIIWSLYYAATAIV